MAPFLRESLGVRLFRDALFLTLLLSVTGTAYATPAIAPAPGGQISAQPELIEQIVVYRRELTAQGVKPSTGDDSTDPEDDKASSGAIASAATVSRFATPLRLTLPAPMTEAQARAWAALQFDPGELEGVLPDRRLRSHGSIATNDSLAYVLWNLAAGDPGTTNTEPVWPSGRGTGVRVAVLDTGRVDHPDMQGVWVGGYDFIASSDNAGDGDGRDADPTDTMSCIDGGSPVSGRPHGLHVASIIAARMGNNEGLAGVAPEAGIVPVRVISSCGGFLSDVLDAMRWAVGLPVSGVPANPNPARILNLSLGTTSPGATCDGTTQAIVNEVLGTGATIVVSTGNDGADTITVPAACQGVIAVAAASKTGKRTGYSNAGAGTTLTAAGGGCASDAPAGCSSDAYNYVAIAHHDGSNPGYLMGSGTSYAAPHVAGAAALLLERDGSRDGATVKALLTGSARAFASGACDGGLCGAGLLDVEAALAPQNFTLSATAQDAEVRAGDEVVLNANVSAGAISPTFSWQQQSGPTVSLNLENGGARARFVAPDADAVLAFSVTATDNTSSSRTASTSVQVSIAPVLAPVSPIRVEPGSTLRQTMQLVGGGAPQAIAVDAAALARGVSVEGNAVVWAGPPAGEYTVEVTPYDDVGSGVPVDLSIEVSAQSKDGGVDASQNPTGGGGGLVGWHGAVLLLLAAWLVGPWSGRTETLMPGAPRTRWNERQMRAATPVAVGVACLALLTASFGPAVSAGAYSGGSGGGALWGASFLHMDAAHLMSNLIGVLLVQVVFARALDWRAWAFALLVAAPVAHFLVVALGLHDWVAGLSTALHAVAAWAIALFWLDERRQGRGPGAGFLLAAGLVVKLVLDAGLQAQWPQVGAVSSVALHAAAAAAGLIAGMLVGERRLARALAPSPSPQAPSR